MAVMRHSEPEFRFAKPGEFPVLMEMWKACFKDSDEGTKLIFARLQKPENILVMPVEGKPAAMLSFAEFALTSPTQSHKAAYIYGVATSPEHQKKSYSTELLNNAHKLFLSRGMECSVLVPAQESLFGFYSKRGYETAFNINKVTVESDEIHDDYAFPLKPLTPDMFMRIRGASFGGSKMFACWTSGYLEYIIAESKFYGGGTFYFTCGNQQICVTCYADGDTVYIKEAGATHDTAKMALQSVHAHFNAKRYVVYLREDVQISDTNNLLPFAMIKWYDNNVKSGMTGGGGCPAYIAHVLD